MRFIGAGAKPIGNNDAARGDMPDSSAMSDIPQIFDGRLRRLRRARAAEGFGTFAFLAEAVAEELSERLRVTERKFVRAVCAGARAPAFDS